MSHFDTSKLRFGANYTPSDEWAYAWMNINPDNVRRDFEGLAALSLDHVRLLPLWTQLQPNRLWIREDTLDSVQRVVDIAGEFAMDASVDVIQGHLSSYDFIPSWIATWHQRNMFTDPAVIAAEIDLVRKLGERLSGAPNFLGLTLGNEVNQFSGDPHPFPMRADSEEITSWLETLLNAARETNPDKMNLHAEYDAAFYLDGHPFTPAHSARLGDVTAIHSWIFNGTAQKYGAMSAASTHHAEYLIELAKAFEIDSNRLTWLQEVGAPSNCLRPEQMPDFLKDTVLNAVDTERLWGITWWCSHDVSQKFADFPELEYSLGLIDSDRNPKPIGRRFAEVINSLKNNPVVVKPRETAIEIAVDEKGTPLSRTSLAPGGAVFDKWVELVQLGVRPRMITSDRTAGALARQEITEVEVPEVREQSPFYRGVNVY